MVASKLRDVIVAMTAKRMESLSIYMFTYPHRLALLAHSEPSVVASELANVAKVGNASVASARASLSPVDASRQSAFPAMRKAACAVSL
eukprot:11173124-Alexandrium_andersonii.AAC.1